MRKLMQVGAVLALAALVAACGGGKGAPGGTGASGDVGSSKPYAELRWGSIPWSGSLDIAKEAWPQVDSIAALVTQDLVEAEPDGVVKKDGYIASNEQLNATTYVYKLNPGIKFSDGRPLTAADVVYSLKRNMIGTETWTKTLWGDAASVSALNASAVEVKLKRPDAVWQDIMSATSPIVERAQAERAGEKALGTPGHLQIGTGPWEFESFKPEQSVTLRKNPYWKGAPQPASKIVIDVFKSEATMALALRSGEIDGASGYLSSKPFAGIANTHSLLAPSGDIAMLQMNTRSAPFNNVHVRRAIAYATNVKGIIEALYSNVGATEDAAITPASVFAGLGTSNQISSVLGSLPRYNFNHAAAMRELAKSPYPHGFVTQVQALTNEEQMLTAAQIVVSELKKIGITATIQEITPAQATSYYGKKIKLWVNEYSSIYDAPESLTSLLLPTSQIGEHGEYGLNTAEYSNAEVDKLMTLGTETLDPAKRLQVIGRVLKIVGTDVPYYPLFSHYQLGMLSDKYVFPHYSYWTYLVTPWALNVKLAS